MPSYLLRAVRQVVVLELLGKEKVVEAETEARLSLLARQFMVEEFPGSEGMGPAPDIEVEIKKLGDAKPVTERSFPEGMEPENRGKHTPPAPF
jgi:hypothetical protein